MRNLTDKQMQLLFQYIEELNALSVQKKELDDKMWMLEYQADKLMTKINKILRGENHG